MTVMDVPPVRLPALAAEVGCQQITLFTYSPASGLPPENAGFEFPLVTPDQKGPLREALAAHGIGVSGIEFFPITPAIPVTDFAAALALGSELGGTRAVTLVFDEERARAVDKLGELAELAARQGLALALEFTPLTRGCRSLAEAAWFVEQVGVDRLGIGVDALHLVRSGGSAAAVAALDPSYLRYCQLCDGHGLHPSSNYFSEAHDREVPGAGDFPLAELLAALPASTVLELEVPSDQRLASGRSATAHARAVVTRARAMVDALPSRR